MIERPGRGRFTFPVVCALLTFAGCADTKPAKIELATPPDQIANRSAHALRASLQNAKGETLEGRSLSYSATPPEVLEVSSDGTLRCLGTGDATLVVSGGGLSRTLALKCRIPAMIDMPADLRLVLGKGPVALQARALGEGGAPMKDVAVPITSSDPSIVAVEGSRLKPIAVGRATIRATLDPIVAVTRVEVVDTVVSERLTLADGGARSFDLTPGTYHVTIDVKASMKVRQGVAVSWSGAPCPPALEQTTHDLTCHTAVPATLTITNPAQIGLGVPVTGSVTVERVPGP